MPLLMKYITIRTVLRILAKLQQVRNDTLQDVFQRTLQAFNDSLKVFVWVSDISLACALHKCSKCN